MNILQQGENFLHAVLIDAENGVTHLIAHAGDKTFQHKLLATGEIVSQELNIPFLRQILQAIDSQIPQ